MSIKFIEQVIELTNEERAKAGLQPLELNQQLVDAARNHSHNMARDDFFSHTGADGSTIGDRVRNSGYQYSTAGENIAAGQTTPAQVVEGWMNSPGHRANILDPNYTEIGVGYEYLPNDTGSVNYNHYWTQVFGTRSTLSVSSELPPHKSISQLAPANLDSLTGKTDGLSLTGGDSNTDDFSVTSDLSDNLSLEQQEEGYVSLWLDDYSLGNDINLQEVINFTDSNEFIAMIINAIE